MCSRSFVVQVNTHWIKPWVVRSWGSLFFHFYKERNHNFRSLHNLRFKKSSVRKWEREGKWSRYLLYFFCCEGTFFYEAASRFSTCREKIGHRVLLIIWQRNNQYFILKWEETSALTTSKHTAGCSLLTCFVYLASERRRQGKLLWPRDLASSPAPRCIHLDLRQKEREMKLPMNAEKPHSPLRSHTLYMPYSLWQE